MPMSTTLPGAAAPGAPAERVVNEQDKRLSADWLKRIDAALSRKCVADAHKSFERNRKLLRGIDPDVDGNKRMRSNIYFAELAAMRPQIYAKDPEFAVRPSDGVPIEQVDAIKQFGETAEAVLIHMLVREAKLKKRAKRLLTAAYTCKVGWWKVCWQEDKQHDPLIENQIKDTQDNLNRLQTLRQQLDDPSVGADQDLKIAELQQTLAGLQSQAEVKVARGVTLDFVLSEDVVVLDASVRELTDYERASALAHRIWFTRAKYRETFGYDCVKGKTYAEKSGEMAAQGGTGQGKDDDLLCVWEVWDQASNRVFQVCDGEEGFCSEPFSPDWTGKRWYPFFALAFNEVDGSFYPLSDVELIEPLVREYNESRDDFVRDRRECLPLNIARKGGSLTDADLQRIKNRQGGDLLLVEGIGGQPISNDIWSGQLGQIRPENYDTNPARSDIEQILGGGDAARGSVLKAKTATEAEILSQGLRGRSAERTDIMEDLLGDVGGYVLQVCLRKLTLPEVQRIAGMNAVWPSLQPEQVFEQVLVEVRGGSTGKPDRLQEQDRWTKLMPVIEKTVTQVGELRAKGQEPLAAALIELTRETLRRFDERIDLNQFLPKPSEGEQGQQSQDPLQSPQVAQLMRHGKQMMDELQAQVQQLQQQLADKAADRDVELQKAQISAATDIEKARIAAEAQMQTAVMRGAIDSQQAAPGVVSAELAAALPVALDNYLAGESGEPMNGEQ